LRNFLSGVTTFQRLGLRVGSRLSSVISRLNSGRKLDWEICMEVKFEQFLAAIAET
jgi:hypothetical protein